MRIPVDLLLTLSPEDVNGRGAKVLALIQEHELPVLVTRVQEIAPELKYDHGDYIDGFLEIEKKLREWFELPA